MTKTTPKAFFQSLEEKIKAIITDPREREATIRIILSKIIKVDKIKIVINEPIFISDDTMATIDNIINRLKTHEPIQYILNECHFGDYNFYVDKNVLIPRSETEELVRFIKQKHSHQAEKPIQILDLCTGCGCIAILLKQYFQNAHVLGLDICKQALKVAKKNEKSFTNTLAIQWLHKDIFTFNTKKKFHIIVSNPPYILESQKKYMDPKVLDHEPAIALFAKKNDPLAFYKAILNIAKKTLHTEGKIYLEINEILDQPMINLLQKENFIDIAVHQDIHQKNRWISGKIQ